MKSTSRALQVRQNAGEIAGLLDHRTRRRPDRHAQLVGDHVGQRRLAETGRAVEQHVIERLAALPRRGDRHVQVLAHAILADVVVEPPRPQPGLVLRVVVDARRSDESIVRSRSVRDPSAPRAARPRSAGRPASARADLVEHFVDRLPMVTEILERGRRSSRSASPGDGGGAPAPPPRWPSATDRAAR